jgi:hypothetical protein
MGEIAMIHAAMFVFCRLAVKALAASKALHHRTKDNISQALNGAPQTVGAAENKSVEVMTFGRKV